MDELRPDIAAAVAKMSVKFGSKREIRKLVEHLWPGETVHRMTAGTYGSGTGLVVLTDHRLFFLKDGIMSQTSEDFPIDRVSSIQWSSGVLMGSIIVFASGNKAEIKNVAKIDGKDIVDMVRARLSGLNTQVAPVAPSAAGPVAEPSTPTVASDADAIFDHLRKLGDLRDGGILSDTEFETKKSELLARL